MCNWRAWILPGLITVVGLTLLALLLRGEEIEGDLTARSADMFAEDGTPWASAQLDGRDVTLQGMAPTVAAREQAIDAANRVFGVYRVDDSLLELLPRAEPYTLSFIKDAGSITIDGAFPNATVRTQVLDGVRAANPNATLVDQTELARGAPLGFTVLAGFVADSLPALAGGTANLNINEINVEGVATTNQALDAEVARLAITPDDGAAGTVAILPPTASPYSWGADFDGDVTVLSGFVPDDQARATFVEAASTFGTVDDQMELGSGEPAGFVSAAQLLLDQLQMLDNASAAIADDSLSLRGEARDAATFDAANAFLGTIPEGFGSISGQIAPPIAEPFETVLSKDVDGTFVLSGVLPGETARAVISDAVEGVGQSLADTSTIARGAPDGVAMDALFDTLIGELAVLESGMASLSGAELLVTGNAATAQDALSVSDAVEALSSASLNVVARIDGAAASPFVFEVSQGEDAIDLSGFVPSEDRRQSVLEDVAALFPGRLVNDNLQVAEGAPAGFDEMVRVGMRSLGRLDDGILSVADGDVTLSGKAFYAGSIDQIRESTQSVTPSGFTLNADIVIQAPPFIIDAQACQQVLLRILADDGIRFETGSASIDSLSFGLLDRLVRSLQSCPDARVEISGHTDSQGGDSANQTLSEERANAVLDYVLSAGIDGGRLQGVGYGEANPVASNDTDEGRAQNRRIEFNIQSDL